ncbi:hypothetical protein ACX93W_07995 [Paenibacillus sp. CAU 1782]
MRQSGKEQQWQRLSGMLLEPGAREARAFMRADAETAEEWEMSKPGTTRKSGRE